MNIDNNKLAEKKLSSLRWLKRIKMWSNKTGHDIKDLSLMLGYESKYTVYNWFRRESVPNKSDIIKKLRSIIDGKN